MVRRISFAVFIAFLAARVPGAAAFAGAVKPVIIVAIHGMAFNEVAVLTGLIEIGTIAKDYFGQICMSNNHLFSPFAIGR